jgi:hypothetical protein
MPDDSAPPNEPPNKPKNEPNDPIAVRGVKLLQMPRFDEPRGSLSFGEYDSHLPFVPLRYFVVFNVPGGETRGDHAHRRVTQALIAIRGAITVTLDDGRIRDSVVLDDPAVALLIPPRVWAAQTFSAGSILLVLCSETYDASEYIRTYNDFREIVYNPANDDKSAN